uniref:Anion exchange protein n=1 Tax=Macrostomum lignano TaxID=282301 RepID=A0A1I8IPH6_9PLAT
YKSDFLDALHPQTIGSFFFIYFACIAPIITFGGMLSDATNGYLGAMESILSGLICGVSYALFAGQPLTILGSTGPVLVFETIVFKMCDRYHWDYLPFRWWIGMWTALLLLVTVALDLSYLVKYITRFTEESFALLIAVIFVYEALAKLFKISSDYPVNKYWHPKQEVIVECECLPNDNLTELIPVPPKMARQLPTYRDGNVTVANFSAMDYYSWDHVLFWRTCPKYGGVWVGRGCGLFNVPDVFFFSCLLFIATFFLCYTLKKARASSLFPTFVRRLISDFAVMIAICVVTSVDYIMAVNGKAVNGKAVNGKAVNGKAVNGQCCEWQSCEWTLDNAVNGKAVNGQCCEWQSCEWTLDNAVNGKAVNAVNGKAWTLDNAFNGKAVNGQCCEWQSCEWTLDNAVNGKAQSCSITADPLELLTVPDLHTPKLLIPVSFEPTLGYTYRGWVVRPFGNNPWFTSLIAIGPALLATILVFLDQQITSVIVNRRENKMRKGAGFHLDLLVVAVCIAINSALGLPWFVAATVLSINHVLSLREESECTAPGERPVLLGCRENRVTGLLVFLCIGLSVFISPLLRHIPMPVLYGVFLFMGVASLNGMQLFDRFLLLLQPRKNQPDMACLREVKLWRVHLFTGIQLGCFALLWVVKKISLISIAFPLMVLSLCFARKLLDYVFTRNELRLLDDLLPEQKLEETIRLRRRSRMSTAVDLEELAQAEDDEQEKAV